jgi:apolipoprotein N-acyltransferase
MRINHLRAFNLSISGVVNKRKRIVKNIVVTTRDRNIEKLVLTRRVYLYTFPGAE